MIWTVPSSELERLTPREREVLDLVAQGLSQREIAAKLDISPRTVEVYKARMMEKLQCRTIADVVKTRHRGRDSAATGHLNRGCGPNERQSNVLISVSVAARKHASHAVVTTLTSATASRAPQ